MNGLGQIMPEPRPNSSRLRMDEPTYGRESYMHRAAKEIMFRWLHEVAEVSGYDNYTELGPLSWRVNRPAPSYGIWMEYPIRSWLKDDHEVWDEWGEHRDPPLFQEAPPTYEWCRSMGMGIACIPDIAIQHKGRIIYAVEIVHKNPIKQQKLVFYERNDIIPVEVKASWIMRQVRRPSRLMARFPVSSGRAHSESKFTLIGPRG